MVLSLQRLSAYCWNPTQQLALTTKPYVRFNLQKITVLVISSHSLEPIICVQYSHFWIAWIEFQGQTRYNLSKFTYTYYRVGHRLKTYNLSTIVAQCSLSSLSASEKWVLRTWTYLWDQAMEGWSVTQWMIILSSKSLQKYQNRNSKLVSSMQVSTWLPNITCNLQLIWLQSCVCKLWLPRLSIHYCARHRFQAFARRHLNYSWVPVLFEWNLSGPVLFLDRSSIWICWFAQICSYAFFVLRDQWMIERLSKAMSSALVCNKFSRTP